MGHFCPPGSGSAIWMRIRIQQLKLMRIRIRIRILNPGKKDKNYKFFVKINEKSSVADSDPYGFGSPGSWFVSFYLQANVVRQILMPAGYRFVTSLWLFVFKNDVNVLSKSNKQNSHKIQMSHIRNTEKNCAKPELYPSLLNDIFSDAEIDIYSIL